MARKTKEEAQATRELILDKAEEVFERQGVTRSSLQDVAEAAGVSRGAIYWHFKDKADLFDAMLDRVRLPCEGACADLDRADPAQSRERLLTLGQRVLEHLERDPQVRRVFGIAMHRTELCDELAPVFSRRAEMIRGFLSDMGRVLEKAQAAGLLRVQVVPVAAAWGYFALIDGLMHNWTLQPETFDLRSVGAASLGAYLDGLFR